MPRKRRNRAGLAAATVAVAALATAAPSLGASHASLWHTSGDQVNCGIEIHVPGTRATEVLCSARGIPTPKKGFGDGGFVQLAATGSPRPLRLSQNSFAGSGSTVLRSGALWSALGVTCHVGPATVMCFNADNHGFVIGNGHYRSF
jgi:hypothetical protein